MWYVIQVFTSEEDKTLQIMNAVFPEANILLDAFVIHYEKIYKIKGKVIKKKKSLFPGYVFFESEDPLELQEMLKKVPEFTRLLKYEKSPTPISVEEQGFLQSLLNREKTIEMSEGYIIGDNLMIMSGPLAGKEGLVKKIDRHKRLATLEIEFLGTKRQIQVGLEVVSKTL